MTETHQDVAKNDALKKRWKVVRAHSIIYQFPIAHCLGQVELTFSWKRILWPCAFYIAIDAFILPCLNIRLKSVVKQNRREHGRVELEVFTTVKSEETVRIGRVTERISWTNLISKSTKQKKLVSDVGFTLQCPRSLQVETYRSIH